MKLVGQIVSIHRQSRCGIPYSNGFGQMILNVQNSLIGQRLQAWLSILMYQITVSLQSVGEKLFEFRALRQLLDLKSDFI